MKRIIDGKIYDTATAEEVGADSYGYPSDFSHWDEKLYLSKDGRFFVAGEGGAMSRWVVSCSQNSWSGSSGIIALTREEAIEWIDRARMSPEEISERAQKALGLEEA